MRRRRVLDAEDGARAVGHAVAARQADADGGVELEPEARAASATPTASSAGASAVDSAAPFGRLDGDEAAHLDDDGAKPSGIGAASADAILELRADVQIAEVAAAAHEEAGVDRAGEVARLPLGDEPEAADDAALAHEAVGVAGGERRADDGGETEALRGPARAPTRGL